jgi:hypothetical protein
LTEVRCATDPECIDATQVSVEVRCPVGPDGLGAASPDDTPFLGRSSKRGRDLIFTSRSTLAWPSSATVDVVRGDLDVLRAGGAVQGTLIACLLDNEPDANELTDRMLPRPRNGLFYLARSADKCNLAAGGSYGGVGEAQDRDAAIAGDPIRCPD